MQNPPIEPEGEPPDDLINENQFGENHFGLPETRVATPVQEALKLAVGELEVGELAVLETVKEPQFYTLDLRFIKSERLGNTIFTAVLLLGALTWIAIRWWMHGIDLFLEILTGASVVVVAFVALFSWIWPRKNYEHTRWRASDTGLEVHKGVFWQHRIIVPMSRVQHADVTQGPMQRLFGLGTLVVHTAGTSHASVELAGIDHQAAIEVRDLIIRFRSIELGS